MHRTPPPSSRQRDPTTQTTLVRGICHSRHGLPSLFFSSPTSTSPSPTLLPHALLQPHSAPTLSHLGAQYLVVIAGGSLCRPKRVVIGPVAVALWVVSPVALLTGPAIAQRAFPTHVVLMDAGHQGPATAPRSHVTEGLVDDTILSAEVIQAICRGNEPRDPLSETTGSILGLTIRKTLGSQKCILKASTHTHFLRIALCA